MREVGSSETLVTIYETTRRHMPEVRNLRSAFFNDRKDDNEIQFTSVAHNVQQLRL
jgi:hypothetical protein